MICEAGPRTPVTETIEVTKRKKEADLGVFFSGGNEAHPQPGSTGTVGVIVSNNGPCEVHATLKVTVMAGSLVGADDDGKPYFAHSSVEVLTYSGGTPKPTVNISKGESGDSYDFTYQFTLPSGGARLVEIKAKDTTPAGSTLPALIVFIADVTGDLPDPNDGNNNAFREILIDPPKKNPSKPTPSKAK